MKFSGIWLETRIYKFKNIVKYQELYTALEQVYTFNCGQNQCAAILYFFFFGLVWKK